MMAVDDILAMLKGLTENLPQEEVDRYTYEGLWDHATRLWVAQRQAPISAAVGALSRTLFDHDAAIGLLALYIVGNKVREASNSYAWVNDFNGALRRIADELVVVPVAPGKAPP
jgi:hypothetical protein